MTVASKKEKRGDFVTRLLSHDGEDGFCDTGDTAADETAAIGVRAGSQISLSPSGGFP